MGLMLVIGPAAVADVATRKSRGREAGRVAGHIGHARVLQRQPRLSAKRLAELRREVAETDGPPPARRRGPVRPPFRVPVTDAADDPLLGPGRRGDAPSPAGAPGEGRDGPRARAASAGDFTLWRNQPTTVTSGIGNTYSEPSWANDRNGILYTGNWGAALSADNGINWSYVNPYSAFSSLDGGFCCDQNVLAVDRGGYSLVFWALQYFKDGTNNHIRLVTYQGRDELLSQSDFCEIAWTPSDFGYQTKSSFDFAYLAATDKYLYLAANVNAVGGSGGNLDSLVWRMKLDELDSDTDCSPSVRYYNGDATGWGTALARGSGSTMYWAYHTDSPLGDQLVVWSLKDSTNTANGHVVPVSGYQDTDRGDAHCPVPDGSDPCLRLNDRLQTGWRRPGEVGWLWNVAEGGGYAFPHIRLARIKTSDFSLIDEPDIWNPDYAWIYGAVGINDRGDAGATLYRVGGGNYPRARAAIIDDIEPAWQPWNTHGIVTSAFGTSDDAWGDFATVHPYGNCPNTWGGAVHSMQFGADPGDAEHRFAWFGRERDGCVDLTVTSLSASQLLVGAGGRLTVTASTRDTGSATSPASSTAFYLSRDGSQSSDDARLGAISVGALAPGGSQTGSTTGSVPAGAAATGTYYLIACADDAAAVPEISNTNNCLTGRNITVSLVLSDTTAVVANVSGPLLPRPVGTTLPVRVGLRVRGPGGARTVDYYLQPARGGRAVRLGSAEVSSGDAVGPPLRFRRAAARHRLRTPARMRQGHYFLEACLGKRTPSNCLPSRGVIHLHGRR
jgi:hypothetical protein